MSHEPIAAIASWSAEPSAVSEAMQMQQETMNLQTLKSVPPGGAAQSGAAISVPEPRDVVAPSAMNLQSLAGQFSQGLQHGFYAKDIERLMDKVDLSRTPGSGVTFGDVTVELLNVQAKVGIADAFAKVSSKLSEGLQTLVVKQG